MKRFKATIRAVWFFFRVLWRREYIGRVGIGESLHCSGVIFDLWMGRFK